MTYIYDIVLNFTDCYYYDFFEWEKKDNIINIKRIPIYHVNKETIYDFINYKIRIDKNFLKEIDNQSIFLRKDRNKYNYSVILSSGEKSIGICLNDLGNVIYKSSMLLDEEIDANRIANKEKIISIKYKKYNLLKNNVLRCDIDKKNTIIKELNNIINNKEYDKLKYIYYEITNDVSDNYNNIYNKLIKNIDNNISAYNILLSNLKIK